MSVATRKELLKHVKERYKKTSWKEKSQILDEFCTLTSYGRKYAINLFNSTRIVPEVTKTKNCLKRKKYDEACTVNHMECSESNMPLGSIHT